MAELNGLARIRVWDLMVGPRGFEPRTTAFPSSRLVRAASFRARRRAHRSTSSQNILKKFCHGQRFGLSTYLSVLSREVTMQSIEWINKAFDVLQWRFRAKDVKIIEGEEGEACVPQIGKFKWDKSEDPERTFSNLVSISEELWGSMSCRLIKVPVRYDPVIKGIVYDPTSLSRVLRLKEGKGFAWLLLVSSVYLHYLNHKSKFQLSELLVIHKIESIPYLIIGLSNAIKIAPWSFGGVLHFSNLLGRASVRAIARKDLIPLDAPEKILKALISPSNKLNVCLSRDFCFDVDIEREAIAKRLDDLKLYTTISILEAPSEEALRGSLKLLGNQVEYS